MFHHLSNSFWPGPLTIVMKAKSVLPKERFLFPFPVI